jgi:hypothetical protein
MKYEKYVNGTNDHLTPYHLLAAIERKELILNAIAKG